jgi:hypothetical protein
MECLFNCVTQHNTTENLTRRVNAAEFTGLLRLRLLYFFMTAITHRL